MPAVSRFIRVLMVLLTLSAGPYRVVAYKFRTFGNIGLGLLTWVGILVGYPLAILLWPPDEPEELPPILWSWLALVLMGYVQMFAKWCASERRDERFGHCWFGRLEPVFACGLYMTSLHTLGTGPAMFFLTGYGCSVTQLTLGHVLQRCEAWTPEHTARLVNRLNGWVAWGKVTFPVVASAAYRHSRFVTVVTGSFLLRGVKYLFTKKPMPDGQSPHVRPPSFMSRVMSHMFASMIWSAFSSLVGFNLISVVCGLLLAIPLYLMHWEIKPPSTFKEDARSFISRAKDVISDKEEKAAEYVRDKKEEMSERVEEKADELKERFDDKKQELADGIARKKRQAMWKFLFR